MSGNMPRFFVTPDAVADDRISILGSDAQHISRVLRMRVGDDLTVCDTAGVDYACSIADISPECVTLSILSSSPTIAEPSVKVSLFVALSKGDKLYVAKAAGSNVALLKPTGLSWREIYVSNEGAYAGTVAVVTKGQILGDRIPEMLDFYKDALTGITFEYENE